jgi:hypothetical protein
MADTGIALLSYILALSGWGKIAYDAVTAKPLIRGRIFNVIRGEMPHPQRRGARLTAFLVYLYLTNARKAPVHILDYELQVFVRGDWRPIKRVYGAHHIQHPTFHAAGGGIIDIPDFAGNLINRKNMPVAFGEPLHGWVMFADETWLHTASIDVFKLTCIDVLGGRHDVEARKDEWPNLYLLQDIAGIRFPTAAVGRPPAAPI